VRILLVEQADSVNGSIGRRPFQPVIFAPVPERFINILGNGISRLAEPVERIGELFQLFYGLFGRGMMPASVSAQ
jgi:hypothetical protein